MIINVKLNNPLMGTETSNQTELLQLDLPCVKLNNPLMGTETRAGLSGFGAKYLLVKLNNPLMGTETQLRIDTLQCCCVVSLN